jgi:hypothetical protein
MARCDEGYRCVACGYDVEAIVDSALYLRYVAGDVPLERLHLEGERHIACDPALAQYIADAAFPAVACDGPFAKANFDDDYNATETARITAAWRRLQWLPNSGLPIAMYPERNEANK